MKKIKSIKIKDKFAEKYGLKIYVCPYCKQKYYSPNNITNYVKYASYCPNCGHYVYEVKRCDT